VKRRPTIRGGRWKRYGDRLDPLRAIFDAAGIRY